MGDFFTPPPPSGWMSYVYAPQALQLRQGQRPIRAGVPAAAEDRRRSGLQCEWS